MKFLIIIGKIILYFIIAIIITIILVYLFLTFYKGIGKVPTKKEQKDYIDRTEFFSKGKFHNLTPAKGIGKINKSGTEITPNGEIPVIKSTEIPLALEDELIITWLGHSSSLVQIKGMNILIDPVLNNYASPVGFMGAKRFSEIPIEADDIPEIDVLLISHDHYDHLDYTTIKKIDKKTKKYLVPLGLESYLISWGVDADKIQNMAWWEEIKINNLTFIAAPALHRSGRNPFYANATWWCGFLIKNDVHSVYYTGDSGYSESFKDVYEKYGSIDIIMADTGQFNDAWPSSHMTPKEALQAAEDTHANWIIPVHWGAYNLSYHNWYDSPELLVEYALESNVNVATPLIGERINYNEINNYQDKWWEDV